MHTCEKIESYRKKAKLTRKALSDVVKITEDRLFKIENAEPSFEVAIL